MKKLAFQITYSMSLLFMVFACEDATESDLSLKSFETPDNLHEKNFNITEQFLWFTFNKSELADGRYKVGRNPATGSKLFIALRGNEVVQAQIQKIGGLVIKLDPVELPSGKDGINPAEFMCIDPNVIRIFEGSPYIPRPSKSQPKYTIYVVPKNCNPDSDVMRISMQRDY